MHKALQYDDAQGVGIIDLIEWYHPSCSSAFKFTAVACFAVSDPVNLRDWESRVASDLTRFLKQNPGKAPLLVVDGSDVKQALYKSQFADTITAVENDIDGADPLAICLVVAGISCLAFECAHPSPRSATAGERDDNDATTMTRTDRELALARLVAQGWEVPQAREQVLRLRLQNWERMKQFLSEQGLSDRDVISVSKRQRDVLFQDLGPFERKWRKLADQANVKSLFVKKKAEQVLIRSCVRQLCIIDHIVPGSQDTDTDTPKINSFRKNGQ